MKVPRHTQIINLAENLVFLSHPAQCTHPVFQVNTHWREQGWSKLHCSLNASLLNTFSSYWETVWVQLLLLSFACPRSRAGWTSTAWNYFFTWKINKETQLCLFMGCKHHVILTGSSLKTTPQQTLTPFLLPSWPSFRSESKPDNLLLSNHVITANGQKYRWVWHHHTKCIV